MKELNIVNVTAKLSMEVGIPQDQLLVMAKFIAIIKTSEGDNYAEKALQLLLVDTLDIFARSQGIAYDRYLRAIELLVTSLNAWVTELYAEISDGPEERKDVPRATVRWVSVDPSAGGPEEKGRKKH